MTALEIHIPRRRGSVYDTSEQFDMLVAGGMAGRKAVEASMRHDAKEHGQEVASHDLGEEALQNFVEVRPVEPQETLPTDTNQ